MLITDWKHSIAYFFLAAFLMMRVANLHTVSHIMDNMEYEHCELCDLMITTYQSTPFQINAAQSGVPFTASLNNYGPKTLNSYIAPYQKNSISDYFHNKPPPSILIR